MTKYLSILLTDKSARGFFSADGVIGADMASVSTVKVWYNNGGSATFTLSDNMAANDDSAANYLMEQITLAHQASWTNVTTEIASPLPGIGDAAGAAVTIKSVVIA
tara:strand:+ start:51 stop:368 length:318 start_codon:yes stop_codon:yes gene_type:complete